MYGIFACVTCVNFFLNLKAGFDKNQLLLLKKRKQFLCFNNIQDRNRSFSDIDPQDAIHSKLGKNNFRCCYC